jgi:hypothetical protein
MFLSRFALTFLSPLFMFLSPLGGEEFEERV